MWETTAQQYIAAALAMTKVEIQALGEGDDGGAVLIAVEAERSPLSAQQPQWQSSSQAR
jgi:hypothetical protein